MKAHSHAVLGAAAWLGLTAPAVTTVAGRSLRPLDLAAGTLVTAGAALLPDLDTPHSSAAHAGGVPGSIAARVLGRLTGGHRHATHSLAFAAVIGGLVWAAGRAAPVTGLVAFLAFTALAIRGLVPGWRDFGTTAGVLTWGVWALHADLGAWLPIAAGLGCVAHALTDALTIEGVPLLWPWHQRMSLPLVGETGSVREAILVAFAGVFMVWVGLRTFGVV